MIREPQPKSRLKQFLKLGAGRDRSAFRRAAGLMDREFIVAQTEPPSRCRFRDNQVVHEQ
jgi:hypothetical protein